MFKNLFKSLIISILKDLPQSVLSMITREQKYYKYLIISTLNKISKLNKCRKEFFCEVLILFLSVKGRINFLQLGRVGSFGEQRYRQQFEKPFAFLDFNKELVLNHGSGHYVIAFDPSYISKSGKKTPGVGMYWSGCAGQSKWGLEIGGIAAIDIYNHTAFHLEAVQTLNNENPGTENLTQWYARLITDRIEFLLSISKYLVADAWFSKKPFVDQVLAAGMHFVSRLRDDADLRYLCVVAPTGKRGRPKKYDGKIDIKNIDTKYFSLVSQTDDTTIYSAIVYSKSLKRNILLVHATYKTSNGKKNTKLYFTTDLSLSPILVLEYYKSRFQIEFLYRDGKQFTGLCDCQSRSENKLHFHFNMALTSINIAKIEDWLSLPKETRNQFSMSDIKTMNHNRLLLNRFFDVFGLNAYSAKNQERFKELLYFGTIAA